MRCTGRRTFPGYFDTLRDPSVKHVLIGGTRCEDLALRLILADVPQEKLKLYPDYGTLERELAAQVADEPTVAIYFELYAQSIANRLRNALAQAAK